MLDPLDFAYYEQLPLSMWKQAKTLVKKCSASLAGTHYHSFMQSFGPVEKVGELFFRSYVENNMCCPYTTSIETDAPMNPGFVINDVTVDVHTRMLITDKCSVTYTFMLSSHRFQPMVPQLGIARNADLYVFGGYNVANRDAYLFGWATADEVDDIPMNINLKHPAKQMNMNKLHPMHTLKAYIIQA